VKEQKIGELLRWFYISHKLQNATLVAITD